MERRELTDPHALRAYAHPTRIALVGLLRRKGPCTATEAAGLTGESVASCSYHLRILAKYGLVEEAGGGVGRQKPWRAVASATDWPGYSEDRTVAEAAGALSMAFVERYFAEVTHWLERRTSESAEWQQAAPFGDAALYLTAGELARLGERIWELMEPYQERLDHPDRRPEAARLVTYVHFAHPARALPGEPGPGAP
ncbi:winged helix-turn-helix domain-containing protein [Streptomyces tsukubensis]|uniref:winged helix-turn-helix domain-containing protein n=1 Tax=Streptomyces tsukubensis TaxID=83656 RepID=UPI0036795629